MKKIFCQILFHHVYSRYKNIDDTYLFKNVFLPMCLSSSGHQKLSLFPFKRVSSDKNTKNDPPKCAHVFVIPVY